jgi:3-methylfumaryl-CoA hydratase
MPESAPAALRAWIGRTRTERDQLSLFPARGMAALLDRDPNLLEEGSPLPAGWHWLYFKHTTRQSQLDADGHTRRGGFLPPIELPRRMWAGGRFRFLSPLHLGDPVELVSTVRTVTEKQGRSGQLIFVTVHHTLSGPSGLAVEEEQDIVYRAAPAPDETPASAPCLTEPTRWREEFTPDTVALFRFSALTFNSHRIHYDLSYARAEGYPDLVVHGPLLALLLLDAARRNAEREPAAFEYRAVSPLFARQTIVLQGASLHGDRMQLWATDPENTIAMSATATW